MLEGQKRGIIVTLLLHVFAFSIVFVLVFVFVLEFVFVLSMEMRSHGACCIVVGGTIKRNYGDVIAAKKGRKLISTLQGFHVIQHKRSYLNNNKKNIYHF